MYKYIFLLFCAGFVVVTTEKRFHMKQVIILSRHNLRTPLSKFLPITTTKSWPRWKEKSGYLTPKGEILEGYMGEFFSEWLKEEGVLSANCPNKEEFYAYANYKQRTKASAQAFVNKAFPNCNVSVHHSDTNDPLFDPIIHNKTDVFKKLVIEEMNIHLNLLKLNESYDLLENILDYKHSPLCERNKQCDLKSDRNTIHIVPDEKPNLWGPLKIGNSVLDAFVMQYYEGFPRTDVAWGYLTNLEKWDIITPLSRGYHNVIFNTSLVARDIAKPLIKYISDLCSNEKKLTKVTLLMGHDANMYTLFKSLDIKPYSLLNQHELIPVGGKIVFQRWHDNFTKQDLLRINFIYQSITQLRNSIPLSMKKPPHFKLLELENCKIDDNGFCLWNDFVRFLKSIT